MILLAVWQVRMQNMCSFQSDVGKDGEFTGRRIPVSGQPVAGVQVATWFRSGQALLCAYLYVQTAEQDLLPAPLCLHNSHPFAALL